MLVVGRFMAIRGRNRLTVESQSNVSEAIFGANTDERQPLSVSGRLAVHRQDQQVEHGRNHQPDHSTRCAPPETGGCNSGMVGAAAHDHDFRNGETIKRYSDTRSQGGVNAKIF